MNIDIMKEMLKIDLELIELVESIDIGNNNHLKRIVKLGISLMIELCTSSICTHTNSPIYRQYIIELMKHFSEKENDEMCQFILLGGNT